MESYPQTALRVSYSKHTRFGLFCLQIIILAHTSQHLTNPFHLLLLRTLYNYSTYTDFGMWEWQKGKHPKHAEVKIMHCYIVPCHDLQSHWAHELTALKSLNSWAQWDHGVMTWCNVTRLLYRDGYYNHKSNISNCSFISAGVVGRILPNLPNFPSATSFFFFSAFKNTWME